jgi:hypothetical protein
MFAGTFGSCSNATVTLQSECVGGDLAWANPSLGSFDDFGQASPGGI